MMKKLLIYGAVALLIGVVMVAVAHAQTVTLPRAASPQAEVKQTIGITEIAVNYSRPKVTSPQGRDRTGNIWGKLVPYGFNIDGFGNGNPIPWRAGANENTTITFTHHVKVEGKNIPAGTYGLHIAVLENEEATVIFSSNNTSWGSYFYEESEDVLRVNIKTQEIPFTEVLTYNFISFDNASTTLALDWEKKRFPIKIEVPVNETVLANFRNELRSEAGFGWQGPMDAAQYCLSNNINNEEALKWIDQSIATQQNFTNMSVKSGLLAQGGKTDEADIIMKEALGLPTATVENYYVYIRQLIGQDKDKEALELATKLNKKWPGHWLAPHSMARAHSALNQFEKSLKYEKQALAKAPETTKPYLEGYLKMLEEGKDIN